jgi:hypothetical protein
MVTIQKGQGNYIINIPQTSSLNGAFFNELKFQLLAESWKEESRFFSFETQSTHLASYEAIIEMGDSALPFIFKEMSTEPNHWFRALKKIVGENPVPPEHKGDIQLMTNDWLQWAKIKNYI